MKKELSQQLEAQKAAIQQHQPGLTELLSKFEHDYSIYLNKVEKAGDRQDSGRLRYGTEESSG
ncbi:MAG: hypothetical protein C4521_11055 [Actinobacteria bacterium]|nr:MAG: hypothetical protein C4521_11055 [Actinomycetota bacterium]